MLRNLEEQKAREEKHRRAKETREMLDRTLRMKMEREAREEQEQLAFDLKLLEEILEASRNEAMEQAQRKVVGLVLLYLDECILIDETCR